MPRLLVALAATFAVAACGAGADHDEDDVAFATEMIEHHAQAIQMANYTIGREGLDPRIAELAEQIRVGQTEEIDQMAALLRSWDEPVPETGYATGDSHSHSTDGADDHGTAPQMPGMLGDQELEALATAPDARFERSWLEAMVAHHQGALAMVDEVLEDGAHEEVAALAERIRADQRREISQMRSWLRG